MRTIIKMLNLKECKKILNTEGNEYTDEEVILIRDWLYRFAEMALEVTKEKPTE